MSKLTALINDFINFLNGTLVPLVFAIAFIVFIWGVLRYFFFNAGNPEKRAEGKNFIMYGLIGFFVMLSVWGLVNLLVGTFHFDSINRPCLPTFGDANCSNTTNTGSNTTPSPVPGQNGQSFDGTPLQSI